MDDTGSPPLHASCVAFGDSAVLISGRSGAGKSALALSLMAMGAQLVADDRVILRRQDDTLWASAPATLANLIEARGVGLLRASARDTAPVVLAVDLDRDETSRLPELHQVTYMGLKLPLLHRVTAPHFAAAILQILKGGRHTP